MILWVLKLWMWCDYFCRLRRPLSRVSNLGWKPVFRCHSITQKKNELPTSVWWLMFHIRMWRKYFSSFLSILLKNSEMDIFALWEMIFSSSRECVQCQKQSLLVLKCWTTAVTDTSVLVCLKWFYVYFIILTERMPRGENRPSVLLSRDENDQVFSLIGPKCQVCGVNPPVPSWFT